MRPIDAEEFDFINIDYAEVKRDGYANTFDDGVQWLTEQIDAAPTLDVVPVVHAQWMRFGSLDCPTCLYKCSNCGSEVIVDFREESIVDYQYCKHCGARMDVYR